MDARSTALHSNSSLHQCTVQWTHIDDDTVHLYKATINDRQKFNSLMLCFDENTVIRPPDVTNEFAEEVAEHEIAEIVQKFKACLRYGASNPKARCVLERARLAYRQLWAVLIVYLCWSV